MSVSAFGFPQYALPKDPCNLPVRRCRSRHERAEKRVLIQRNGAHGDILMATPILTALRDAWPDCHLTWLVEYKEAPTLDAHPEIDELLLWDSAYWKGLLRRAMYPAYLLAAQKLRRMLQFRNYDIYISYQPEEWAYLVAQACGAGVKIGVFDTYREFYGETRTSGNVRHYTRPFVFDEHPTHRTEQYLLPLRTLGLSAPTDKRMRIGYTPNDRAAVDRYLEEVGLTGRRFVVLAPMTTWPSRCWPAERYAAVGNALQEEGLSVVLIGSVGEKNDVEAVAERMRRRPLLATGNFTFRELAAFLDRAALVVSGDTGPMHLAAAVDTPYLAVFGSTAPERFAPLAGRGVALSITVPCGPCYQKNCTQVDDDYLRCLRPISVAQALDAARKLLVEKVVVRGSWLVAGSEAKEDA